MTDALGTATLGGTSTLEAPPESGAASIPDYSVDAAQLAAEYSFTADIDGTPIYPYTSDPFEMLCTYGDDFMLIFWVTWSLFEDARADSGDRIPDGGSKRGWLGNSASLNVSYPIARNQRPRGSKLWLLSRSKATADIPALVAMYARQSLEWLRTAELVSGISTAAKWEDNDVKLGLLLEANGKTLRIEFEKFWNIWRNA